MKTLLLLLLASPVMAGINPLGQGPGTVDAGSITGGPVASSILPSTVAYTSVPNTFTSSQTVAAAMNVGAVGNLQGTLSVKSTSTVDGSYVFNVNDENGSTFRVTNVGSTDILGISGVTQAALHMWNPNAATTKRNLALASTNNGTYGFSSFNDAFTGPINEIMTIDLTGNGAVGINKAAPGATLHVVSTTTTAGEEVLRVDQNDGTIILDITQAGQVGIGTTSPATVLDVNGDAQFGSGATKSTFTATGFLNMGGATNLQTKTLAQLQAITPALGDAYRCSNCAVAQSIAIATGTGAGNFAIFAPGAFQ